MSIPWRTTIKMATMSVITHPCGRAARIYNVLGALCILAALPQGWVMTLMVAIFLVVLQGIVIGQILSPRVFSKTVGVHPIVALFALFAGAELFGVLGGVLSVPVAGVLQQIIVAIWHRWKNEHPEQFPPEESPLQHPAP